MVTTACNKDVMCRAQVQQRCQLQPSSVLEQTHADLRVDKLCEVL